MQTHGEAEARPGTRKGALLASVGLAAALASVSCCILPLALFLAGVSGAWIGTFTSLEPYQPAFLIAAIGMIALGWRYSRRSAAACADGSCALVPRRLTQLALWAATLLVVAAIGFPYVAPAFLNT